MDPQPLTVTPDDLVADIADQIKDVYYGAAIAVDEGNRPVGSSPAPTWSRRSGVASCWSITPSSPRVCREPIRRTSSRSSITTTSVRSKRMSR